MLDKLRSAANSWAVKIFLGIVLASFVLWEVPSALRSQTGNTLLTAGKSTVKIQAFQLALDDILMRNAYAAGRYLTQDEISQFAIPQRVFGQMYSDVTLDEVARQMKIGASVNSALRLLAQDPLFKGMDGQFDKNRFLGYLQQIRATQADVFARLDAQAKREQLVGAALGGLKAPDALYTAFVLYQGEKRKVDYLELTPALIGKVADPDDKTLASWFESNKTRFRAPEYRQFSIMRMTAQDLARPEDVTEQAVKDYYENNRQHFSSAEKRTLELLRFSTRADADKAAAELADGTSFDKLVAAQKQTLAGIRKGPLTRAELPQLMASDVFALDQGAVSPVINDLAGPVLVRVVSIQPGVLKPLASVEAEIRNEIANNTAAAQLRDNQKKIENARFEGATLKELAKEYGLTIKEVTIDADGNTPDGKKLDNLPEAATLIPHVFQGAAGVDADPLNSDEGYLWYHIHKIIPATDRPLAKVRSQAVALWKEQETRRRLDEKATVIKKELDAGATLDTVARREKLAKKTEKELQRGSVSKALGEEATAMAFSTPRGQTGLAAAADGRSRLVFTVTGIDEPRNTGPETLSPQQRDDISAQLAGDLSGQLISFALAAQPVVINNELYRRILQGD